MMPIGETCQQVTVACNILAPFYLHDPKEPQLQELVAQLASLEAEELTAEWPFCAEQEASPGLVSLIGGARRAQADIEPLRRAYRRLFVGPNHLVAPPWGSVYTDHEKVKFGESCIELGVWMRRRGIQSLGPKGEPADQIGTMLALLGWLAQERPELAEEYLLDHLLTWAGHYLDLLVPVAREEHELYHGLALLTRATLDGLQHKLGLKVVYPRYFM